jgi:hypothetical protein
MVDREWEGFDTDQPETFAPLAYTTWGLRTKGHSIENYWLRVDSLQKYLSLFFPDVLSVTFFADLENRFGKMLKLAAAYSFGAKKCNIISRCGDAVSRQDVEWTGVDYVIVPSFSTRMAMRGVAVDAAVEVNTELSRESLQVASHDALQWMCHGHLAEEMIRACTANLAAEHGTPVQALEQVERGRRLEKQMSDADFVAGLDDGEVDPLGHLLEWAE